MRNGEKYQLSYGKHGKILQIIIENCPRILHRTLYIYNIFLHGIIKSCRYNDTSDINIMPETLARQANIIDACRICRLFAHVTINFRVVHVLGSTFRGTFNKSASESWRPDNRQARGTLSSETSAIVKVANFEPVSTRWQMRWGGFDGDETGTKYES